MYKVVLVDIVVLGVRWLLDFLFKVDLVFDFEKKFFGI